MALSASIDLQTLFQRITDEYTIFSDRLLAHRGIAIIGDTIIGTIIGDRPRLFETQATTGARVKPKVSTLNALIEKRTALGTDHYS
jgi:hypothetical protein